MAFFLLYRKAYRKEEKTPREAAVKTQNTTISNAIKAMLHLQSHEDAVHIQPDLHDVSIANTTSATTSEEALQAITQCIQSFGEQAKAELYAYTDHLQEDFLLHLHERLRDHKLTIREKLSLSLGENNTLILECAEQEEALLTALGTDDALRQKLSHLREATLQIRGLEYLLHAQDKEATQDLGQFKVCTKGSLSHFYLR